MKQTTIAAIATPVATGSIGVVRISGSAAREIAGKIFVPVGKRTIHTVSGYSAIYGRIRSNGEDIDEGVALVFVAPHSYTGEDVVELSCHGGVYVLGRVLQAALEHGAMPAGAGEFTKRAFLNGKLSLTQGEAVMDLISAKSHAAAKAALAARDGVMSRQVATLGEALVGLAAHLAAWIDYPEEEIEELEESRICQTLEEVQSRLKTLLKSFDTGRILREGVPTAIIGRPNVGKSTLMNLLSGFERSIVTDIPGTTRDVVEDVVRLEGDVLLRLADTAGIHSTGDPVEALGVRMANHRLESSELILAVFDGSRELEEPDRELLDQLAGRLVVPILNKADLPVCEETASALQRQLGEVVRVSAQTGEGGEELVKAIGQALHLEQLEDTAPILANERQRDCVRRALSAVEEALEALSLGVTLDAISVCVDEALEYLLELDGKRVADTVVDQVFANFCVGK